jgi:hypothetical protein
MKLDVKLHPKQGTVLSTVATEILYGGAAGGGKSHVMRILAILLCLMVPMIQVYIFRKKFGDLYKNHMEGTGSFPVLLWPLIKVKLVSINYGDNYIKFWNGSKIHLCHLQHTKDLINYQGAEINVLLMDELTHFTEPEYRFLRNRVRLGGLVIPEGFLLPGITLRSKLPLILSGTNPGGIGHNWVKRSFVDYCEPHEVIRTRKKEGGMLRTYIPARLNDNPTLTTNDPEYEDRLEGLGDPALVKAMKDGDWNIVSGGALDDVWKERHVIPRFKIPKSWKVDRSFDWGSTHPFSVGWWATSNGEEVQLIRNSYEDGQLVEYKENWMFPAGSLIRLHEWYGSKEIGLNKGLKLSATEISKGIISREKVLRERGWINGPVRAGPADGQIYQQAQSDVPTIAAKMAKEGVRWVKADKSPGSRINGLELMRDRLKEEEGAGLFFMSHCRAAISTLPVLPRDETNTEDVDTKSEDHVYDEVRYRVLASSAKPGKVKVRYAS